MAAFHRKTGIEFSVELGENYDGNEIVLKYYVWVGACIIHLLSFRSLEPNSVF